jgi:hypothetical protein
MQQLLHEAAVVAQVHKMIKLELVPRVSVDLLEELFSMVPEMLQREVQVLQQMDQMDLQHLRAQVLQV